MSGFSGGFSSQSLYAANTGRHAGLTNQRDEADVACPAHVSAAAQFDRPADRVATTLTHGNNAYFVAVFFPEQGSRARCDRIVDRHQAGGDRRVLKDEIVGN